MSFAAKQYESEQRKASQDEDVVKIPRNLSGRESWKWEPLLTNPYGIMTGIFYVMVSSILAYVFQGAMRQIEQITITYKSSPGCEEVSNVSDVSRRLTQSYECFIIPDQPNQKKTVVEKFVIDVTEDLNGPLYIYHEVRGMYQNHNRYVKSTETYAPFNYHRWGSYTGDSSYQLGTKKSGEPWSEAEESPMPADHGMYNYWHPRLLTAGSMQDGGQGCYPHWSTEDTKCLDNVSDCPYSQTVVTESNGDRHVKGNRPYYPCGLAFRNVINDTFAITEFSPSGESLPLDQDPRKLTFEIDWLHKYRNLDPLSIFDFVKAEPVDGIDSSIGQSLNGFKFFEVLSMWMMMIFPPTLCNDDPLQLLKPMPVQYYDDTVDCDKYTEYDPDPSINQASCNYQNLHNITNPLTGQKVQCQTQIPNPGGWNLEHTVAINWVRIAASGDKFWKLAARIHQNWKKGDKKVVYIANRYDISLWDGQKSLVITSEPTWVGNRSDWIPQLFLATAACGLFFSVVALLVFGTNNDHLERIKYLAWPENRNAKKRPTSF